MDLDIPEKLVPVRDKIDQFVRGKIDPLTDEYYDEISVGDRWQLTDRQLEILDGLKAEAKEAQNGGNIIATDRSSKMQRWQDIIDTEIDEEDDDIGCLTCSL